MEEKKLQKVLSFDLELISIINNWVNDDVESFLANGIIEVNKIPEKREELFKKYVNLFYSLL